MTAAPASAAPEGNAGSAAAALRQSLECITESDSHFNAVLALDPTRAAAEAALEDARDGSRPPLSGMPVLLKDNIESKDPNFDEARTREFLSGLGASEVSTVED